MMNLLATQLDINGIIDVAVPASGRRTEEATFLVTAGALEALLAAARHESDKQVSPELVTRPAGTTGELPVEPLTEREARVLRYLPSHLSGPEIARELYVSVNTIRTHLRHLYGKLGVQRRREAVDRARELGLLARVHA